MSVSLAILLVLSGPAPVFERGPIKPLSMGTLCFAPEGVLFVGDSIDGKIYAIELGDQPSEKPVAQRIDDLEATIGSFLGTPASEVMIHDMAVNPVSGNTYLTVSRGRGAWRSAFHLPNDLASADTLLRLDQNGTFERVDLTDVRYAVQEIANPIAEDRPHVWKKGVRARVDAISDLVFQKGKLYVAGLSNEEFASTLRIVPFPFGEKGQSAAVEVYHGAHGAYETASPIRAMIPYTLPDGDYVLAAYLCTPLAVFPKGALEAGGKVRGKTIGELGSGNYPTDMLHLRHEGNDLILVSNTNRTLMVFDAEDIAEYARGEGITSRVAHRAGVPYTDISGTAVMHMDLMGEETVQMIQRLPSGKASLYGVPMRVFVR